MVEESAAMGQPSGCISVEGSLGIAFWRGCRQVFMQGVVELFVGADVVGVVHAQGGGQ